LIVDAYVNIFNNLIVNQVKGKEFVDQSNKNERPTRLQAAAGNAGIIAQQPASGPEEPISNSNCMIIAEQDKRRGAQPKSKVTITFPDYDAAPAADLTYLNQYAQIIHDLYDGSDDDKKKARQFMFAVMMMTRCR
jgi:hypothetical protein